MTSHNKGFSSTLYSRIILLLLVVLIFQTLLPCALAKTDSDEIVAGVPSNFPPQYQVDARTGKPNGFAIDVMDEVARRSGINVRYVVYGNFSEVIAALRKGEIDLVPNLGITDERTNYTDFTTPFEASHIHIFLRSTSNGIKNIDDLAGRKVAVVAENQGYFIMKEHGGSELLVYNSMEEALMSLISGNADAMVYPEETLLRMVRQSGIEDRIKTTGDGLVEIKRAIGVRKGQPELYNKLDEAVKAFILTPEYEKLYMKWYGKPEPYWNTERVLAAVGSAIALVAAIFFIFHYFSVLRLNKKLADSLIQLEKSGESLHESEARLLEAQTTAHIGNWEWKIKTNELYWAEENYRIFGLSRDVKPSVEAFLNTVHPDDLKFVQKSIDDSLHGKPYNMDMHIIRPDGQERIFNARAKVFFDEENKPVRMSGTVQDITEGKLEEEKLKLFRDLIDRSNDSIFIVDPETGIILDANEKASSSLGYTRDELKNMHVYDFEVTLPDSFSWKEHVKEIQKNGSLIVDGLQRRKDGTIFPVEVSLKILEYGNKSRLVALARDTTERKQMMDKLIESEKRLAEAQRIAHIGNWELDLQTNEVHASEEAYRLLDATPNEMTTFDGFMSHVHPEDREIIRKSIERGIRETGTFEHEHRQILKDGSVRLIYARGKVAFDSAGKPVKIFGTAMDSTERKQAEKALKESEEKYHALMNEAADAILLADTNGNVLESNKKAEELLSYTKEEFSNMNMTQLHPKEELERTIRAFKASTTLYEGQVLRKDGKIIPVDITVSAIKYSGKKVIQGIFRDITDRKKSEEMSRENERLVYASKAKNDFLSNMSHELRTPLNSVIGFSELLKMKTIGDLNEKQEGYVDNIRYGGKHLLNVISDILDLSKLDAGKMELVMEYISVPETLNQTIVMVEEMAKKNKVSLKKELAPELEFIEADKQRFIQIVFNLLSNAIKFNRKEGGTVTVTTTREGDMAKFSISDTGIGIKEEDKNKLFNDFEQLDSGISKKYGGTGLGLAVTKKLVELHGGKIRVESEFGVGSTFTFMLPIKANKEK